MSRKKLTAELTTDERERITALANGAHFGPAGNDPREHYADGVWKGWLAARKFYKSALDEADRKLNEHIARMDAKLVEAETQRDELAEALREVGHGVGTTRIEWTKKRVRRALRAAGVSDRRAVR